MGKYCTVSWLTLFLAGAVLSASATVARKGDTDEDDDKDLLRIHLPRKVHADDDTLTLGELAVVRGGGESTQKAAKISMGRAPWSGEKITLDRATILSRLASEGFKASSVRISGARQVVVTRNEEQIAAERLISCARAFLQKRRPGPTGCSWRLARKPEELFVPSGLDVSLRAELPEGNSGDYVRVDITALANKRTLGRTVLLFKTVYPVRRAVAAKNIPAGEMVTPKNTETKFFYVENRPSDRGELPYGMLARRTIAAGAVIRPAMVRNPSPSVAVRRNQTVTMKITGAGFVVTAIGRALQDGSPDDLIKVQNVDTARVVRARVLSDGSVEPVVTKASVSAKGNDSTRRASQNQVTSVSKEKR